MITRLCYHAQIPRPISSISIRPISIGDSSGKNLKDDYDDTNDNNNNYNTDNNNNHINTNYNKDLETFPGREETETTLEHTFEKSSVTEVIRDATKLKRTTFRVRLQ